MGGLAGELHFYLIKAKISVDSVVCLLYIKHKIARTGNWAEKDEKGEIMQKTQEKGVCPNCGEAGALEYGDTIGWGEDNEPTYPWDCPNCGAQGKEHYKVVFAEHEITLTQEDAQQKRGCRPMKKYKVEYHYFEGGYCYVEAESQERAETLAEVALNEDGPEGLADYEPETTARDISVCKGD